MTIARFEYQLLLWRLEVAEKFWLTLSWICGKCNLDDICDWAFDKALDCWEDGWEITNQMRSEGLL
jgi:hypothetical protein